MGDLFEDDWDDDWDEALDRRLRAELLADLGPTEDAYATLQTLTPTFVRAARVRRAQTVLASAAMVLAFAGGALFAVSLVAGQSSQTSAAGVGDEATGALDPVTDGHPTTLEVSVTSGEGASTNPTSDAPSSGAEVPGDGPTTQAGVGEAATDSVAATQVDAPPSQNSATPQTSATAAPPSNAGTPRPPTTTRPAPTAKPPAASQSTTVPTSPTTTRPSSSTSLASNQRLVQSSCGDMVVRLGGSTYVTLDRTVPDSGYQVDVKSSGPNNVEVSFEGSRRHCELWARFDDGQFKTSGDGDHHDDDD